MKVTTLTSILDVGGLPYNWIELGYQGNVTCVGLSPIRKGRWGEGNIKYMRQDATALPYSDKAFDIVYSNSLLEHVGRSNQQQVTNEIRRVGQKYWVQVPNRTFPFELHYYALFFHQMPHFLRKLIATYWTPLVRKRNYYLSEVDTIYLPNLQEMQTLFPDGEILREKVLGLTKSLIAVKNDSYRGDNG